MKKVYEKPEVEVTVFKGSIYCDIDGNIVTGDEFGTSGEQPGDAQTVG